MAKRRTAKNAAVKGSKGWQLQPLPPDFYNKPPQWSRPILERTCAKVTCSNVTTNDILCDTHFYEFVRVMQGRVTDLFQGRHINGN